MVKERHVQFKSVAPWSNIRASAGFFYNRLLGWRPLLLVSSCFICCEGSRHSESRPDMTKMEQHAQPPFPVCAPTATRTTATSSLFCSQEPQEPGMGDTSNPLGDTTAPILADSSSPDGTPASQALRCLGRTRSNFARKKRIYMHLGSSSLNRVSSK